MDYTTATNNVGGQYTNGTPPSIPPTKLEAAQWNALQNEIIAAIVAASITPNAADETQLSQAIAATSASNAFKFLVEGRLTLTSGLPVTYSDVLAATNLYYTPYKGERIGLYAGTGSNWSINTFTEITLDISSLLADTLYDIFIFDSGGTITLEAVAWASASVRDTAITLQNGVYCKSGELTKRYLGTIRITSTAGQCEDSFANRFVYNYYHRKRRGLLYNIAGTWTYGTDSWRAANGDSTNAVNFVVGVQEDNIHLVNMMSSHRSSDITTSEPKLGIGINSSTTDSASLSHETSTTGGADSLYHSNGLSSHYYGIGDLGFNSAVSLERVGSSSTVFLAGGTVEKGGIGGFING